MSGLRGLLTRLRGRAPVVPRLVERLSREDRDGADDVIELLFDDAPYGTVAIDRQGRVVRANKVLRDMLGPSVALVPGVAVESLFAVDERASVLGDLTPLLNGRTQGALEFVTRLEGVVTGVEPDDLHQPMVNVTVASMRDATGTVCGALLRLSDISLQKRLEAQLAHSQKLQAVGQLAGGIAHDFNNLLTAVLGAAESINLRTDLDPETRDDAAHIQASAERGAALVRQLLAFGRQQTLQPRVLQVNEHISDISGLLRRLLGSAIRLELDLENPGRTVRADPTQIDQVLINLAVNARDAMPHGGDLTLRSGHITLYRPLARGPETIPPGRYVMIEVRDTGVGIPADVMPRIFDPFFTTKRDRGGNGLGLSTVHGIIRQSDGFLAVESEPAQGTSVRVYLPRWDGQEAVSIPLVPREEALVVRGSAERRVLLVDDEDPVRRLAERALLRNGWQVLSAESGDAALALLEAQPGPLSAVVTDMVMPGMDGVALLRTLRQRPGMERVPAILVSGYAEETLRRGVDSTATAFMPKPYTLKDLVAKLDEIASGVTVGG